MALDKYANLATAEVTLSAANTLTFAAMETGLGITPDRKSAMAMIIDEIDYLPQVSTMQLMSASGDELLFGITTSNAVSDLSDITDRRIIHSGGYGRWDFGTAASGIGKQLPFVFQFFPPLITAERRIYLAFDSVGLASAVNLKMRIYYRTVEITQADFVELAEVFRMVG